MATKILTIGIPEETWKKIKRIAALQGKSVSALVREQIEKFLGEEDRYKEVHKKISAIAKKTEVFLKDGKEKIYAGCKVLFTEDLSHGMKIAGVEIVNPFFKI